MNPAFETLKKSYAQLGSDLVAAKGMLSLVVGLRKFFREPVTFQKANEEIKRALETREQRFLDLVRTQIYDREGSPYLKLLQTAGCDFADIEGHVRRGGLEKTLERLAKAGVYLTSDESKGKTEVVRGGVSVRISPEDLELQNPGQGLILTQSSGTSGQPQRYALSLDNMGEPRQNRASLGARPLPPLSRYLRRDPSDKRGDQKLFRLREVWNSHGPLVCPPSPHE
jgi:hypothetical protein